MYTINNIRMHTRYSNVNVSGGVPVLPIYNVPVVVGGICGYTNRSTLLITNVVMDFLCTAITNAGLIMGNRDALSLVYIRNVTSERDSKYAKGGSVNMYRCIYKTVIPTNLTILDYNILPYGQFHNPSQTTTCKYTWLLPFVQATYTDLGTLLSPEQVSPCTD